MQSPAPPRRPLATFLEGVLRGSGMLLPGLLIAFGVWYQQQDLTQAENVLIVSIVSLLFFCVVGYSVFHRLLWYRFGRVTLFFFVTWTFTVACTRALVLIDPSTTSERIRLINTLTALFFTLNLVFFVWLRPWLIVVLMYLYGPDPLELTAKKEETP